MPLGYRRQMGASQMTDETKAQFQGMGFTWGHFLQIAVIIGSIFVFFLATEGRLSAVETRQIVMTDNYNRDIADIKASLLNIQNNLLQQVKKH